MWLIRLFQEVARQLNRLAGFAILAFVFLMMLLLEVDDFARKIGSLGKGVGAEARRGRVAESAAKIRNYMLVRTLLSVVTGLAVWGFAVLMGVEPAVAWGLLAFALNYIPFIGSFVATLAAGPVRAGAARIPGRPSSLVILGLAASNSSSAIISSRWSPARRCPSRPSPSCSPCSSGAFCGAFPAPLSACRS